MFLQRYKRVLEEAKFGKDKISPFEIKDYIKFLAGILSNKTIVGPLVVQFDVTNRCNSNCTVCWVRSPYRTKSKEDEKWMEQELPYELIIKTIDRLVKLGMKKIFFAGGGEPFKHPHFLDILTYCKKKGLGVEFNTNFSLVTKEKIDVLLDNEVDIINVSLWAGDAETYVKTHPKFEKDTFEQIKDNLFYMQREKKRRGIKKPHLNIYNVLFTTNYQNFDAMMDIAYDLRVDSVDFTLMDPIIGATDKFLLSDKQKKELGKKLLTYNPRGKIEIRSYELFKNRLLHEGDAKTAEYDKSMIDNVPCYAGNMFIRIGANGNVDPCLKAHKLPIGNLYEESIDKIWWSHAAKTFRKKTQHINDKDPYFSQIGNDPNVKCGCYLSCDNIGYHQHLKYNVLVHLTKHDKKLLKNIAKLYPEQYEKK